MVFPAAEPNNIAQNSVNDGTQACPTILKGNLMPYLSQTSTPSAEARDTNNDSSSASYSSWKLSLARLRCYAATVPTAPSLTAESLALDTMLWIYCLRQRTYLNGMSGNITEGELSSGRVEVDLLTESAPPDTPAFRIRRPCVQHYHTPTTTSS